MVPRSSIGRSEHDDNSKVSSKYNRQGVASKIIKRMAITMCSRAHGPSSLLEPIGQAGLPEE